MTRIIAGAIGSLQLKPAAKATRPTADRVKESLFAKLDAMGVIEGAKVLDLFAGTGALGLESASRGADSVTLIERDRKAFELLTQNVNSTKSALERQGLDSDISPKNVSAQRFLSDAQAEFDLVFLDPPYEIEQAALKQVFEALPGCLKQDALLVFERSSRVEFDLPSSFRLIVEKSFGDTVVMFIEREEDSL